MTSARVWLPEKDDGSEADAAFEPLRRQMFVFSHAFGVAPANRAPMTAQSDTDALEEEDNRNLVPDARSALEPAGTVSRHAVSKRKKLRPRLALPPHRGLEFMFEAQVFVQHGQGRFTKHGSVHAALAGLRDLSACRTRGFRSVPFTENRAHALSAPADAAWREQACRPSRDLPMPNKMLIDATHPEETRVVVLRGNRVEEFDFESAHRKQLRGNIYLAKVTRVEPSLQAAFVDYGGNRHGFLAFSEIHPDYYQIPVADRQALIDEEERAQRAADDEVDRRSRRHRHHGNHPAARRDAVRRGGSAEIAGR